MLRALLFAGATFADSAIAADISMDPALALSRQLNPTMSHPGATFKEFPVSKGEERLTLTLLREFTERAPASKSGSVSSPLAILAVLLFVNILLLAGSSFLARSRRESEEARAEDFSRRWKPILYGRMAGDPIPLPDLAPEERVVFLNLWLHTLGYVRDEDAGRLIAVANELDMRQYALRLLESRVPFERLLAIRTARELRLKEAIVPLLRKAAQRRPRSSLEAVSALLKISPDQGLAALRALLAQLKWSPGAIAGMLEPDCEGAAKMLAAMLTDLPPGDGKQVIRLIELLDDYAAVPVLRERLRDNPDAEETAVILHALSRLGGAPERTTVLGFLQHEHWLVRMQGAAAVGVLGLQEDSAHLLPLLRDRHWWVRYRAAQAFLRLGGAEAAHRARAAESDRYAADILDRVVAEC